MVFAPDMAFPIKDAPSFPQSQVYRFGGGVKGGDQCDPRNFTAPWRDNYCEKRGTSSTTPWCPVGGVHLGQDIRVGTPEGCNAERRTKAADRQRYAVVAVEDGVISNVGSYSVNVRSGGRIYRYLHLNMAKLSVKTGDTVKKGDVIGYVSNDFGGTPTTLHLHFEIKMNTAEHGWAYVPPYSSLLAAYQRRESNPGALVADGDTQIGVASTGGGQDGR
ncbi:peptidoglycan DD-metalloendopeptidase family protein [bacterium]|nr:peptidoglycan DD-metalloendopeptidase family protein [bacterium]